MIKFALENTGIFRVHFMETVTLGDIEEYLEAFQTLQNLPNCFMALYDLRGASLDL